MTFFNVLGIASVIGVVVLALVDYSIYEKLSRYLYMSAGMKNRVVDEYLSYHNHSRYKLYKWMSAAAVNPNCFKRMKRLCFAPLFFAAFSVLAVLLTILTGRYLITEIYFCISLIATVLISKSGFSYAKQVKNDFDSGMVYDSENSDYIDALADGKHRPFLRSFNFMSHMILSESIPFIIGGALVICGAIVVVSYNEPSESVPPTQSSISESMDETEPSLVLDENAGNSVINLNTLFSKLADEGLYCDDISSSVTQQYTQYSFDTCVRANDNLVSFTGYVIDNEKDAKEFCSSIVTSLMEGGIDFSTENYKVDNHSVTLYSNESEYGYIAVLYSENTILYMECDYSKTEWLRNFLYDNGLLETI